MLDLGNCWASQLKSGTIIFLCGDLGAGKTTLVRGILGGLGYDGVVASPTYTLVEHYAMSAYNVYHLDLYRLQDPADIEILGVREMSGPSSIMLIEWPERAAGKLPSPDYQVDIRYHGSTRKVQVQAAGAQDLISGFPGSC